MSKQHPILFSALMIEDFAGLWNGINSPAAWGANPWVAAYTFEVIQENVLKVAA